jgi:hypothetical protein
MYKTEKRHRREATICAFARVVEIPFVAYSLARQRRAKQVLGRSNFGL